MTELPVAPLEELRRRTSAKWRQHPPDVLPLTVAESDFALNPAVAEVLQRAIATGDTGYAWATTELGEAFAPFAARRWGWVVDPARVTPVPNVATAVVELFRALRATRVGISPPVYPPFPGWVVEAGATVVEIPLTAGRLLDLPALDRAFAAGLDAYLLCSPHNPVGRVHDPAELTELIALAHRHGVMLVSDEIHAALTLPGATFTPILTLPGAAEVAVAITSGSKTWNLAGLTCAAVVSGSTATDAVVARMSPDTRYRIGHLGVLATVAALRDDTADGTWLDRLVTTLDHRRAQLGSLLAERLPQVAWQPPEATYLAWLDCRAVGTGDAPRERFLARGVAVEPGRRFGAGGDGFVRLNFATGPEVLEQALTRMGATGRPL